MAPDSAEDVRTRMRRALVQAMKARDQQAVAALRSTLAAIDNAEAVDGGGAGEGAGERARPAGEGHPALAGTVPGVGAAEVERRSLTPADMEAIVRSEMADRQTAARTYEQAGHPQHADRLRAEAKLLGAYLDAPASPAS